MHWFAFSAFFRTFSETVLNHIFYDTETADRTFFGNNHDCKRTDRGSSIEEVVTYFMIVRTPSAQLSAPFSTCGGQHLQAYSFTHFIIWKRDLCVCGEFRNCSVNVVFLFFSMYFIFSVHTRWTKKHDFYQNSSKITKRACYDPNMCQRCASRSRHPPTDDWPSYSTV